MFLSLAVGMPHLKAGSLRALAIAARRHFVLLPEVPTMTEAGVPLEVAYWIRMAAPAGTPSAVVATLEHAMTAAIAEPDVQSRLSDIGVVVSPLPAPAFAAFIRNDLNDWAEFVAAAKIKLD